MTLSLPPPAPWRAGPRMGIRVDLPLNPRVDALPAAGPRSRHHRRATWWLNLLRTQQPNGSDTLRLAQLVCDRTPTFGDEICIISHKRSRLPLLNRQALLASVPPWGTESLQ